MTTENSSEMKNAGCCDCSAAARTSHGPGKVYTKEELMNYATSVRLRIKQKNGEFFRNKNWQLTSIVLDEFLNAAQRTFWVFCGHLCKKVYEPLMTSFMLARERGVDIRVVTAYSELESPDLAQWLRDGKMLKHCEIRDIPHFVLVDGDLKSGVMDSKYRLEMNDTQKTAVICACVADNTDAQKTAQSMAIVHESMWKEASVI